ncbi:hypothetical protein N7481_004651 [Penicillium waksmanii]|uniref:uncharacterized protein n=1 Tax=Penicillium waksmanii TaxID=69791 RepID=UPI002548475A|nr:uncharacterized protein N7481_004651 [Penicillium waksmanii]KAJ5989441.1 hypothetical protein N7481_004651 [Penicillium waksmanii]
MTEQKGDEKTTVKANKQDDVMSQFSPRRPVDIPRGRKRNEVRVTSAGLKRDPGVSRGPQGGLQFVTAGDP